MDDIVTTYYSKHKEEIAEKRKKKYREDEEYRNRIKARNQLPEAKVADAAYYERNKERIKARQQLPEVKAQTAERMRLYREAHPEYTEKGRVLEKKYRATHKEQIKEKNRKWLKTEKGKLAKKRYNERHPETLNKARKKWRETEIGKFVRKVLNYKRRGNTVGKFTATEWRELCDKHGNKCLCCGEQKKLTADHVIPLKLKGENVIANIQPLCLSCNSRKGAKVIDYRRVK